MKYQSIDSKLFIRNRKNFASKLKSDSIAIFVSNDEMPRGADSFYPFRQNPDMFYLTGIDQEQSLLVLYPNCPKADHDEVLFLRRTDEVIAVWEGHKYTKAEAATTSGIKKIYWLDEMPVVLNEMMNLATNCYLNLNEHDRYASVVTDAELRFARMTQKKYPLHHYHRSAPILHDLRAIKDKIEVELIQTACNITGKAFERVCKFIKPGVYEYEIEAEIAHEYLRNRATGPAYGSIIASGKNACVLHYHDNNQQCNDGDLILMDFGSEYANYASDLTRTIPVNGKFTKRQKEVYNSVLAIMKAATKLLKPGVTLKDYHEQVGLIATEEMLSLNLITKKEVKEQSADKPAYKKYFMHGTSHFLGLDVHDVGHRYKAIKEGMVFTVEPGIYIPAENMGIRIENDVLVKSKGNQDLMGHIPREVEEIEALMKRK